MNSNEKYVATIQMYSYEEYVNGCWKLGTVACERKEEQAEVCVYKLSIHTSYIQSICSCVVKILKNNAIFF